jgi:hypothetical protein
MFLSHNADDDALGVVPDNKVDQDDPTPSVAQVLRFALPAVSVSLCWPLLALQDTSAVAGVVGAQAALHPAVALLNYVTTLLVRACLWAVPTGMRAWYATNVCIPHDSLTNSICSLFYILTTALSLHRHDNTGGVDHDRGRST